MAIPGQASLEFSTNSSLRRALQLRGIIPGKQKVEEKTEKEVEEAEEQLSIEETKPVEEVEDDFVVDIPLSEEAEIDEGELEDEEFFEETTDEDEEVTDDDDEIIEDDEEEVTEGE